MKAKTSAFVFAWTTAKKGSKEWKTLAQGYEKAKGLALTIDRALKDKKALNGLYLNNKDAMIEVLNSIDGMLQSAVSTKNQNGIGSIVEITNEFFGAVLSNLNGNVSMVSDYLHKQMGNIQATAKEQHDAENLGIMFVLVSLDPFGYPSFTLQYACVSEEYKDWLENINCGSTEKHSYDYKYTSVKYTYVPPEK